MEQNINLLTCKIPKTGISTATPTCSPFCVYFPDMECKEHEWVYDEKQFCKVRKEPKVFRCMYDNHPIDWNVMCPRNLV